MRPYPITERDEIGAGLRERSDLVETCGIAHAWLLEYFGPPRNTFLDGVEWRAAAQAIGLAEHHVIGASLACEHGIMTAVQAAGAGDALGFERADRGGQRFDAGEMGAVGAGADRDLGMAVEEKRNIAALNDGGDRFGAIDQRALVARFEAKQNGGDIAGVQRRGEVARKRPPDRRAAA